MNLHLGLLDGIIKEAHMKNKKILLHLDLTRGLSADVYGCEYACQVLQVDGIISTKVKVIESAKKCGKVAILRFFLIDSKSLEKGILICNTIKPDYVEVLPGIAYEIIPYIKEQVFCEIMCGGLIKSMTQVEKCIEAGACSVTISEKYKKIK
jgi:glycerol uptake operon antiterminator